MHMNKIICQHVCARLSVACNGIFGQPVHTFLKIFESLLKYFIPQYNVCKQLYRPIIISTTNLNKYIARNGKIEKEQSGLKLKER